MGLLNTAGACFGLCLTQPFCGLHIIGIDPLFCCLTSSWWLVVCFNHHKVLQGFVLQQGFELPTNLSSAQGELMAADGSTAEVHDIKLGACSNRALDCPYRGPQDSGCPYRGPQTVVAFIVDATCVQVILVPISRNACDGWRDRVLA